MRQVRWEAGTESDGMRVARGVGESCTQLELVHGGMPDRGGVKIRGEIVSTNLD